jgi:hypothetical protein
MIEKIKPPIGGSFPQRCATGTGVFPFYRFGATQPGAALRKGDKNEYKF